MEKDLKHLINLLSSSDIFKKCLAMEASSDITEEYTLVIEEIMKPYEHVSINQKINFIRKSIEKFLNNALPLANADKQVLEELIKNVPIDDIVKTAKNHQQFIKLSNYDIIKESSWWGFLRNKLSFKAFQYLFPFVSLIFAIVHFYYFFMEYARFINQTTKLNIKWQDAINPQYLINSVESNKSNPGVLLELVKLTKTNSIMITNLLSTILNYIDFIKDIVMLFVNIGSLGLSIMIDLGISAIILIIEMTANYTVESIYKEILNKIKDISIYEIIEDMFRDKDIENNENMEP